MLAVRKMKRETLVALGLESAVASVGLAADMPKKCLYDTFKAWMGDSL